MDDINRLKEMIEKSKTIVAFTGAGVSTESGIPDFRSKDGLYNDDSYDISPEIMLSAAFFYHNPEKFYEFYKSKMDFEKYKPNITHKFLKKLETQGKLKAIITQNIDGLHTKAGSTCVYEVHGTTNTNTCIKCGKKYDRDYVFKSSGVPRCECGGLIKPDFVFYGEPLPDREYNESIKAISNADMLLVLGTSLTVYPAAGLINLFNGKYLVIINKDKTPFDNKANLVINKSLKEVFEKLD